MLLLLQGFACSLFFLIKLVVTIFFLLCQVIPFPLVEIQSKWVASVLSGRVELPSQEEMMMDVEAFYLKLDAAGLPKRYTHSMSDYQVISF